MLRLGEQIGRRALWIDRIVGDDDGLRGSVEPVDVHLAVHLALGNRNEHVARTAYLVDPWDAASAECHGGDGLGSADLEEAVDAFSAAISFYPNDTIALFYRGGCYIRLDEDHKAIDDFSSVIDLDPANQLAYLNRAIVYVELEEYSLAWDDVWKAIELGPDYSVSYHLRGNIYLLHGEWDEAVWDYEVVLSLDPEFVEARLNRMAAYRAAERWWIFNKTGKYVGDFTPEDTGLATVRVEGGSNPSFEEMDTIIRPLGDRRVNCPEGVIFLDVDPEGLVDAVTSAGFILSTERDWTPRPDSLVQ